MAVNAIIVDDSRLFRELLSNICKDIGCHVMKTYERGDHLVDALKGGGHGDLEVLFLDINMPGPSGKDVLVDVMDLRSDLIVIMISTFSDQTTVEACLTLGATNYINKDTKPPQIKEIIENTFDMNGL